MKVFIVNGIGQYDSMFRKRGWKVVDNFFDADLIQFTGGEDVSPEIYGEKNTHSYNDFRRDELEAGIFAIAKRMGKSMAGICRGGQFLNVMCGGSMIQHVEGHAINGTHQVTDYRNNQTINVTSTHHQMMQQTDEAVLIAGSNIVSDDPLEPDAEVLYYPEYCALCFQPHPEHNGYKECTDYYFELLDRCLGLRV